VTDSTPGVAGAVDVGAVCPYCRFPLKPGVGTANCNSCGARYHSECWSDTGGCTITGCSAAPPRAHPKPAALPERDRATATTHPPAAESDGRAGRCAAPGRVVVLLACVVAILSVAAVATS